MIPEDQKNMTTQWCSTGRKTTSAFQGCLKTDNDVSTICCTGIQNSASERFNIYNRQFDSVKSVYKEYCKHYYNHITFVAVSYAMSKDGEHLWNTATHCNTIVVYKTQPVTDKRLLTAELICKWKLNTHLQNPIILCLSFLLLLQQYQYFIISLYLLRYVTQGIYPNIIIIIFRLFLSLNIFRPLLTNTRVYSMPFVNIISCIVYI